MGNYEHYKFIKYGNFALRYYLVFALFVSMSLTLSGNTSEYIGFIFLPMIILYFLLKKVDLSEIGNFDAIFKLNDGEPIFVKDPSPGTSLMEMLKHQNISCKDIQSISFMACSLQHWSEYYQDKLDSNYKLNEIERIDVYAADNNEAKLNNTQENIHLFPTKVVLTRHINLIRLKNKKLFVCYEPEHLVVNGEDRLNKGSFLFEVQQVNIEKMEQSFLREVTASTMKEAA